MRPESYPIRLPRQPGQKEVRFAHLLSGDVHVEAPAEVVPRPSQREALEQKVDMLATDWNIYDSRAVRKFVAAGEHTADKQRLFIRAETEHNARTHRGRCKEWALALIREVLLGATASARPRLRHRLNDVGIANAATA